MVPTARGRRSQKRLGWFPWTCHQPPWAPWWPGGPTCDQSYARGHGPRIPRPSRHGVRFIARVWPHRGTGSGELVHALEASPHVGGPWLQDPHESKACTPGTRGAPGQLAEKALLAAPSLPRALQATTQRLAHAYRTPRTADALGQSKKRMPWTWLMGRGLWLPPVGRGPAPGSHRLQPVWRPSLSCSWRWARLRWCRHKADRAGGLFIVDLTLGPATLRGPATEVQGAREQQPSRRLVGRSDACFCSRKSC